MTTPACLPTGRRVPRPRTRWSVLAVAAITATTLATTATGANAVPLLDRVQPAASAAAKKKAKKFNRKLTLAGGVKLSPKSKFGTNSYAADGTLTIKGSTVAGRLAGRLAGSAKSRRGLPRDVKRLLKLRFTGKIDLVRYFDPGRYNPIVASGTIGGNAKGKPKLTACGKLSAFGSGGALRQKLKLAARVGRRSYSVASTLEPVTVDGPPRTPSMVLRVKSINKAAISRPCKALARKAR